jgi:hypothetical protein
VVDHIAYYWLVAYKKPCVIEMFLYKATMQGFANLGACTLDVVMLVEPRFHPLNKPTIYFSTHECRNSTSKIVQSAIKL